MSRRMCGRARPADMTSFMIAGYNRAMRRKSAPTGSALDDILMKRLAALLFLALAACGEEPVRSQQAQPPVFPRYAEGLPSTGPQHALFGDDCPVHVEADEIGLINRVGGGKCTVLLQPGFSVAVEHFEGPAGPVPLFIFRPRQRESIRRIVVRLVGGPGGDIAAIVDSARGAQLARLAAAGTATVSFGYAGTRSRLVEGRDTIDLAADELVAYLRFLDRKFPGVPKIVLGESLGGYVASQAARRLQGIPLVLAAPPLATPRTLAEYFDRTVSDRQRAVEAKLVTVSTFEGGRIVPVEDRMVNTFQIGGAIFSDHLDVSVADLLPPERARCYTLIYGTADRVIGIAEVPALRRRLPEMRVVALPGIEHDPRLRADAERLYAPIGQAIEQASCPGSRAG